MIEALHGYISGKVQGVSFRAFTQEQALAAGLTGWARNLPDGRVEVLLQGESAALVRVARALHEGPPHAEVREVSMESIPLQTFDGFTIG